MEYRSCPNLFLTSAAREFLEEHLYLEKHPHTAPAFHDQRPRFRAFQRYFLAKVREFREAMEHGTNGALPEGVN